jgi:hypothetical protein
MVYSWANANERALRVRWIGALVMAAALTTAAVMYYPRRSPAVRGPDTVAVEFMEALMQAPADAERLRAAGHLEAGDELPPAIDRIVDRMATRLALDYLHARLQQNAGYRVRVIERRQPEPRRYAVLLAVGERAETEAASPRRFQLGLQQLENGDWRVTGVSAVE